MIVYTKGSVTSYDMVTPISSVVHPCFNFRVDRIQPDELGIHDGMSALELKDSVKLYNPVGCVIIDNTEIGDVVDATGRPTQGGLLVITAEYVMLAYTADTSFTVCKSSDMKPHFGKLLPTSVLSTEAARSVGAVPVAYTFVDGGLLEIFEQTECARLPYCSYAISQSGRLVAVFGLRTGSCTLDFKPNGTRGSRASLLSKTRRHVRGVSYDPKVGAFVSDVSGVRTAIEELRSTGFLSKSFCYSFNRPESLSATLATRLAFLLLNTAENRVGATNVVFLASGGGADGDLVTDFVNVGIEKAQFLSQTNTSFAWIQQNNDELYNKLISENLRVLETFTNNVVAQINNCITKYRSVQEDCVPFPGVLDGLAGLLNLPMDSYTNPRILEKCESVEQWQNLTIESLKNWSAYLESGLEKEEDGGDGPAFLRLKKVRNPDGTQANKTELQDYLDGDENYKSVLSTAIGKAALEKLKSILPTSASESEKVRFAYEKNGKFTWTADGSGLGELDMFESPFGSGGFLEPSRLIKNWHECHKCDHHCERSLISVGPGIKIGDHPRSGDMHTGSIPASAKGDLVGYFATLPYHTWSIDMNGHAVTTVRAGYGARDMVHVRKMTILRTARSESGKIHAVVDVKVATRYFDMFGGWEPEYRYHQLNKDIVRQLLSLDGVPISNVSLAGIVRFPDNRPGAPRDVVYKNYGCLPDFTVNRPIQPSYYDGLTKTHTGEPYTLCDYTLLNVCLELDVDEPETVFGDHDGSFAAGLSNISRHVLRSVANTAAEDLVTSLDSVGAFDKVRTLYDLDGTGKNFILPSDAIQLTDVNIDSVTASRLAAQLLLLRESRNRDSGVLLFDPSDETGKLQRANITMNVQAILAAGLMDYTDFDINKVANAPDADGNVKEGYRTFTVESLAAYLREYCGALVTADKRVSYWFRGDLSGITPREQDLRLWPYYGALA